MSLLNVVRKGIKVADKVVKSLEAEVSYYRFLGDDDEYGTPRFASAVKLRAIVEWKQRSLRTMTGQLSVSRSSVQFLSIQALVLATDGEGIDDNDKIVLPDGTTGPILDMSGFIDAGTGHPLATEVFLG